MGVAVLVAGGVVAVLAGRNSPVYHLLDMGAANNLGDTGGAVFYFAPPHARLETPLLSTNRPTRSA